MKNIIKFYLAIWLAFSPMVANAQLAPAAIKPLPTFNALANGGFENGKTGWLTYKDAAGALPVDGVSGTATTVTFTAPTTTPLFEKASGLITHAASNGQGEGLAYDFVVNSGDKGKVLTISGTYQIASGAYSGGTATTDSDIEVYIYNKDTSTLIQPSGYKLDGGVIGINYSIAATFQTDTTSTNYRLIFHNATTTATAFTIKLDSLYVGTQTKAQGPPITDLTSYTPTISGFGTPALVKFVYRRDGDKIDITGEFQTGTTAATTASITLPAGLTIDTNKSLPSLGGFYGTWTINTATGSTRKAGKLQANSASGNSLVFANDDYTTAVGSGAALNGNAVAGNAVYVSVHITGIPVQGWSSSVTMSDSSDTRATAARAENNASSAMANATFTIVPFATVNYDSHGGFDGVNKYTVRTPGYYRISASTSLTGITTTGNTITAIYKNGAILLRGAQVPLGTPNSGSSVSAEDKAVAGDYYQVYLYHNNGTSRNLETGFNSNYFMVSSVQGPSQIAASESINAKYTNTAGTTIGTGVTLIPFGTKVYDTHGAYVTNTFTAPAPGKYQVSFHLLTNTVTLTTTQAIEGYVYKNGALHTSIGRINGTGGASNNYAIQGVTDVDLLAGETVDVRALSNVSIALITTNASYNSIEIKRVGN